MFDLDRDTVVSRPVVCSKQRYVWRVGRQRNSTDIFISPILMDALLMFIMDIQTPVVAKSPFNTSTELYGVGRMIIWIDNESLLVRVELYGNLHGRTKGVNPAILRKVVIEHTDSRANDGLAGTARGIRYPEARADSFSIVFGNARSQRDV